MKNPFSSLKLVAASLAIASLLCLPAITRAAPVTFTLDSTQSYISALTSGNAFGLSFGPQAPGSMTAYYSGTIVADLTGGVLTFSGGSSIVGINNPGGPFSIAPFPGGPLAGQYGVTAGPTFLPGYGFVTINGVYSGMTLDLTTGTAQNGFAPSGMTDKWTAGTLTYGAATGVGNFGGPSSLANVFGSDTSAGLVYFDGNALALPITFHTTGSNRNEYWGGELVGYLGEFTPNPVPEPSTLALAGLGLLGLTGLQFSRSRRSR